MLYTDDYQKQGDYIFGMGVLVYLRIFSKLFDNDFAKKTGSSFKEYLTAIEQNDQDAICRCKLKIIKLMKDYPGVDINRLFNNVSLQTKHDMKLRGLATYVFKLFSDASKFMCCVKKGDAIQEEDISHLLKRKQGFDLSKLNDSILYAVGDAILCCMRNRDCDFSLTKGVLSELRGSAVLMEITNREEVFISLGLDMKSFGNFKFKNSREAKENVVKEFIQYTKQFLTIIGYPQKQDITPPHFPELQCTYFNPTKRTEQPQDRTPHSDDETLYLNALNQVLWGGKLLSKYEAYLSIHYNLKERKNLPYVTISDGTLYGRKLFPDETTVTKVRTRLLRELFAGNEQACNRDLFFKKFPKGYEFKLDLSDFVKRQLDQINQFKGVRP